MQKSAFERKKTIIYQPISFSDGALSYVDPTPARLPDGDIRCLHYHDCIEVGICLAGSGIFLFGNRVESVSVNDAFLIPPSTHHYSKVISTEPCLCAFVYLDVSRLTRMLHVEGTSIIELLEKHTAPIVFRHGASAELCALAMRIYDAAKEHSEPLCALRATELLLSASPETVNAPDISPNTTDPISAVAEYMALHYRNPISNHTLAELSHLSESQLRRRFLTAYGLPPHAYLNRLRCRIGAEMLTYTARTVEDIATAVGYGSASDFYRHFKDLFDISPTAWRNTHRR